MRNRGFIEIIGILALLGVMLFVLGGAAMVSAGTVKVEVREKNAGGFHFAIPVPVNLVRVGLNFIPDEELAEMREELEPWMPAIQVILEELEACPDGPLVEVESGRETVSIVKRGREIVIDVDTPDESVHISIPLTGVGSILEKLTAGGVSL